MAKKKKSKKMQSSKNKEKNEMNSKLGRKEYETELARLQAELVKLPGMGREKQSSSHYHF